MKPTPADIARYDQEVAQREEWLTEFIHDIAEDYKENGNRDSLMSSIAEWCDEVDQRNLTITFVLCVMRLVENKIKKDNKGE